MVLPVYLASLAGALTVEVVLLKPQKQILAAACTTVPATLFALFLLNAFGGNQLAAEGLLVGGIGGFWSGYRNGG